MRAQAGPILGVVQRSSRNIGGLTFLLRFRAHRWNGEGWRDGHVAHGPVGSFRANDWGLHDVHGNLAEWCEDWYPSSLTRVYRGGAYIYRARVARASARLDASPGVRFGFLGLYVPSLAVQALALTLWHESFGAVVTVVFAVQAATLVALAALLIRGVQHARPRQATGHD